MIDWEVFENAVIIEALGMLPEYSSYPTNYYQASQILAEFMGWA